MVVGLCYCKDTMLIQFVVHQDSQVFFCTAAFHPVGPGPVCLHGKLEAFALGYEVSFGPFLSPVVVPWDSSPAHQHIRVHPSVTLPTTLLKVCSVLSSRSPVPFPKDHH